MTDNKYAIGVDVGGTKTAYGLYNNTELVQRRRHDSNAELPADCFFDVIAENIREMIDIAKIPPELISGVGVALPSFIRASDGLVLKTANLPNIKDYDVQKYLKKALPEFCVTIGNDNHAAVLSEHRYGAGRGHDNMLYCLMSTGFASGIIINGKLFRGSLGYAGESGHMILTPDEGILCGCGNRGCISSYASGSKIAEHVCEWIASGEQSIIPELAGADAISAEHIDAAYQLGDKLAGRAIEQMIKYTAVWLYNLYVTLNINCFAFGGGILKMKTPILSLVRERFNAFSPDAAEVGFHMTELGEDFGIFAASRLPELL